VNYGDGGGEELSENNETNLQTHYSMKILRKRVSIGVICVEKSTRNMCLIYFSLK
jgi:hypothetical protein